MGVSSVDDVLAKAAQRAQRLAELEPAWLSIEKTLGIPVPMEMLPWSEVMS